MVQARTTKTSLPAILIVVVIGTLWTFVPIRAQDFSLPDDAGLIDVTAPPFNAAGDGVQDDTQAIQQALNSADAGGGRPKMLYFPRGTYLVSNTIEWKNTSGRWMCCVQLWGESREETIIRLQDQAPGYGDTGSPKAVLYTASINESSDPSWWADRGEGNKGFRNSVYNMTVDVGRGNPGAIGIDYVANNIGTIRRVTITSSDPDGAGRVGVAMERAFPGPALLHEVDIVGFDYGITIEEFDQSMTLSHVTLQDQRMAGIRNRTQVVGIYDLTSTNAVPVIENDNGLGLISLVRGDFSGGSGAQAAIVNHGGLYVRDVHVSGYGTSVDNHAGHGRDIGAGSVDEFSSHDVETLFDTPAQSLELPIMEPPAYEHPTDFSRWANVEDYGAHPDDYVDDTAGIQAAIDSGKEIVYVPNGQYHVGAEIVIRGNVRKIYGMSSWVEKVGSYFDDPTSPKPLFKVADGTSDVVAIENFWFYNYSGAVVIEHATSRTLVIRDAQLSGTQGLRNTPGAGDLFLENVAGHIALYHPQRVWAWQFDPEGPTEVEEAVILNEGADLWVVGCRTEEPGTWIKTSGTGRTEILGGSLSAVYAAPDVPILINDNASISLSYATTAHTPEKNYDLHIRETRHGTTRTLTKDDLPRRDVHWGSLVPLYTGVGTTGQTTVSITAPAEGTSFTAPATIDIEARVTSDAESVQAVEFFANGSLLGDDTTSPYAYTWSDAPAGSYALTARVTTTASPSATSPPVHVEVHPDPDARLPTPWQSQDVGAVSVQGQARFDEGTFTVEGSGQDIWENADAFQFVYQPLSGDGQVTARVTTQTYTHDWAKAGVMVRESLDADARHAMTIVAPSGQVAFQRRVSTGGVSTSTTHTDVGPTPLWVRLKRTGETLTGYWSADGTTWIAVDSVTVAMTPDVFVGLCVTSHDDGILGTATFDGVAVDPHPASINQLIPLDQGWNFVSLSVLPETPSLEPVLTDVLGDVVLVKDGQGRIFSPEFGLNQIGSWDPLESYMIYLEQDTVLSVRGQEIAPETAAISIDTGWNFLPYLRRDPLDVEQALSAIAASVVVLKDETGRLYFPEFGVNTIGQLQPGRGYKLYADQAATLTYPANNVAAKRGVRRIASASSSTPRAASTSVLIVESFDAYEGEDVQVRDPTGRTVGQGTVRQGRAVLTVRGDSPFTRVVEGAQPGDPLSLTITTATAPPRVVPAQAITDVLTSGGISDGLRYEQDAVLLVEVQAPTAFSLEANYPNPFNPTTMLRYTLPRASNVMLTVYDVLGERVATLVDERQQAGSYEVRFDGAELASGLYVYVLKAGEQFVARRPMLLVK